MRTASSVTLSVTYQSHAPPETTRRRRPRAARARSPGRGASGMCCSGSAKARRQGPRTPMLRRAHRAREHGQRAGGACRRCARRGRSATRALRGAGRIARVRGRAREEDVGADERGRVDELRRRRQGLCNCAHTARAHADLSAIGMWGVGAGGVQRTSAPRAARPLARLRRWHILDAEQLCGCNCDSRLR